eukprot:12157861-Ditylum_brightwellii.AAC.2
MRCSQVDRGAHAVAMLWLEAKANRICNTCRCIGQFSKRREGANGAQQWLVSNRVLTPVVFCWGTW